MIAVNSNYTNIIAKGAQYEWQVDDGRTVYDKSHIISGTLSSGWFERLSIGNCIAKELDLELWNVTMDPSRPIIVRFRAVSGLSNSLYYTPGGYFYIDTVETSPYSEITKVTAFDAMLKTETAFMPTGSYVPMTTLEAAQTIATDLNITLNADTETYLTNNPYTLSNAPHVGANGTTDREMLSYIGIIYSGNWIIDRNNKLKLVFPYLAPENTANVGDAVVSFDASAAETVKRVKLWLDSETYYLAPTGYTEEQWLALGGRCIEAELPFYATQAIANNILANFNNKTFYPYTAQDVYVGPEYEPGDGITIKNVTSIIATQRLHIDPLASSDLEFAPEEKINSLYPYISTVERTTLYQIGQAQADAASAVSTANAASNAASAAQTAANGANYREQLIYKSQASGSTAPDQNATWVTNTTGNQNVWTTKRPVYNSSYPVLYVATQRQSVSQKSGTTCTCTDPVVDQTTTVIDGGHITTGTIDAGTVNVTNINASNISSGTLSADRIAAGSIAIGKLDSSTQTTISDASSNASTALSTANTANTNASSALTKANANLASTVSVYYRSTTNSTPTISTSTSIGTASNTDNAWEYVMPYPKSGCYFYTCEKYTKGDGTVTFSTVRALSNATYTSKWCSSSDSTYIDGGRIYANSITASQIAGGTITSTQLSTAVNNSISTAQTTANNAQTAANGANAQEQLIYASKASGTSSLSGTTTWVTDTTGGNNKWTLKRPTYSSSYPVLFVATQRKTVAGTVTCTTPQIDNTTTVIDGGHITTGSIDAGRITVGTLSGITISGNTITGGTLTNATSSGSVRIADGSIGFFKNATTTGTPFSTIKHVTDSEQGDSIVWSNTGYTKIVNTGGGQWTAAFLNFKVGTTMMMQMYADSYGMVTKIMGDTLEPTAQVRLTKTGSGDSAALRVQTATSNKDTCIQLKRTDTDRAIELLIGSGGVNRGLYIRDANYSGWLMNYDDTNINLVKPVASFSMPANNCISSATGTQSWLNGTKRATILNNTNTSGSSSGLIPYLAGRTATYHWALGTIGDNVYIGWVTNANYDAGTSTATSVSFSPAGNFSGKAANVTGTVAIANGGTGATDGPTARSNLGMNCPLLKGSVGTSETTITTAIGSYSAFIVRGTPGTTSKCAMMIPKACVTTSYVQWEISNSGGYIEFEIKYSGTTLYLKTHSKTVDVYGLAGA